MSSNTSACLPLCDGSRLLPLLLFCCYGNRISGEVTLPLWLLLCFHKASESNGACGVSRRVSSSSAFPPPAGLLQELLLQQYISCCAVVWENGDEVMIDLPRRLGAEAVIPA